MSRQFVDLNLQVTKAHPAASATAYSDAIDLGETSPGNSVEGIDLKVTAPAVPDLEDDKSITLTIQDSADGSSFAAVPELATLVQTGAGGAGAAAASRTVKLPPSVRRYVRVSSAVEAVGGDNTGVSFTAELRF